MKNKKRNRLLFLFILLLGITIGFAALATTLKINGTANIGKNTWDVHWANVGDIQKSSTTTITTGATVNENDSTEVDFEVTLNQPGDYYEFQVDAVNAGTIDAMANIVSQTTVPSYASLTVKYADGEEINQYDLLAKAPDPTATPPVYTTERIKVRLEFSRDIDEDDLEEIGDEESIDIAINIPYDQADDNANDRHADPVCPGPKCAYAFYTTSKNYSGVNASTLTDYTNDYTTLKKDGVQRQYFLGHILDSDKKIVKAYACGLKGGTLFCVEGATDNSAFNTNKEILLDIYGTYTRETFEPYTENGCNDASGYLYCYDNLKAGNTTGTYTSISTSGYVEVDYGTGGVSDHRCEVSLTGTARCIE